MADYSGAYDRSSFTLDPSPRQLEKRIKELEAKLEALTPKGKYRATVTLFAKSEQEARHWLDIPGVTVEGLEVVES